MICGDCYGAMVRVPCPSCEDGAVAYGRVCDQCDGSGQWWTCPNCGATCDDVEVEEYP